MVCSQKKNLHFLGLAYINREIIKEKTHGKDIKIDEDSIVLIKIKEKDE